MNIEIPDSKKSRLNITITGEHVELIEELRTLLEKRLRQRLSIAQVLKRLALDALQTERTHSES